MKTQFCRHFTLVFLLALSLAACNNSNDGLKLEDQQWDQVMAVHDEVMPRMSEINRLTRDLRGYVEKHPDIDSTLRNQIFDTIQELEAADEGMMSWMSNVQAPTRLRQDKKHEEIMSYLGEQEKAISEVRQAMLNAIERGEKLIQELPATTGED